MVDEKKEKKFQPEGWRRVLSVVLFFAIIQLFADEPFLPRPLLFAVLVAGGMFWFVSAVSPRSAAATEEVAATLNGERIFRSVWLEIRQFGPGGDLSGAVMDGPFAGRVLSSLTDPELLELIEQFDHADRISAKALRAWVTHARPHLDIETLDAAEDSDTAPKPEDAAPVRIDQRERDFPPVPQPASIARQKYDRVAEAPPPPRSHDGMSEAEAFAVLGILDTKDASRIRNAYERAVKMAGGEAGGAHETLARLKLARRILLGE